jgi:hypothetical protein
VNLKWYASRMVARPPAPDPPRVDLFGRSSFASALGLCSFLLACPSHPRDASHSPPARLSDSAAFVPEAAAWVDTSLAAASLPSELARIAPSGTLWAGPFDWPPGGASALIGGGSVLVWKNGAGGGTIALPRAAARAIVRDVTGDGKAELVLFSVPPTEPFDEVDETRTWIFGITRRQPPDSSDAGPMDCPARMWLLEGQLIGATDEASLDGELARLGSLGPTENTSPRRLVVRLRWATPKELRALIGAPGLKLCRRQGETRHCTRIAQESIDKALVATIAAQGGPFAEFAFETEGNELDAPYCQPEGEPPDASEHSGARGRVRCTATIGGPAGGAWVFEKTGRGLRLAEVWAWREDS